MGQRRSFVCGSILLGLAGCGGDDGDGTPSPWTECDAFECAQLEVPIDWSEPDGPTMEIAVIRSLATVPEERLGAILFNNGGPGAALYDDFLIQYAGLAALVPELVERFDLVVFDPRGIGRSGQVEGPDDATLDALLALDPSPDDDLERAARVDAVAENGAAFVANNDALLLANLGTENVARDMEVIREAVGDETISYLGVSYGTLLGATYMTMFPDRVRAFVLDSPVTPTGERLEHLDRQAAGYEESLDRFLADCGADAGCAFHGGEGEAAVAAALDALLAGLEAAPLDGLTEGTAGLGLEGALRPANWTGLADALADAEAGDGEPWLALGHGFAGRTSDGYDGFVEAFVAISCVDRGLALDFAAFDAHTATVVATAPRMGPAVATNAMWCIDWPVERPDPPVAIDASAAPPALVLAAAHDPATPIANLSDMVTALGNGSYQIVYEGDGHGQIARECMRDAAAAFLVDPVEPAISTCAAE